MRLLIKGILYLVRYPRLFVREWRAAFRSRLEISRGQG